MLPPPPVPHPAHALRPSVPTWGRNTATSGGTFGTAARSLKAPPVLSHSIWPNFTFPLASTLRSWSRFPRAFPVYTSRREPLSPHSKPQPLRADSFGKGDSPQSPSLCPSAGPQHPGGRVGGRGGGERGARRGGGERCLGETEGWENGTGSAHPEIRRGRAGDRRPLLGMPPPPRPAGSGLRALWGYRRGFAGPRPPAAALGAARGAAVGQSHRARSGAVTYCCCGETERERLKQGEQIKNPTRPERHLHSEGGQPRAMPTQQGETMRDKRGAQAGPCV